jgi:Reverse transcriptase (RNA-dependent DNA polymerase)
VTLADARSGYWQLSVRDSDRWLTAFIFEGSLFEWCRTPFGLKTAGNTFCRCVELILQPIRDFSFAFVDVMTKGSENWSTHLVHLCLFITELQKSGLTLSIEKCKFAHREVRFVGQVVGSGHHRPDERKLESISTLTRPQTKKDIRKILGFFNHLIPTVHSASCRTDCWIHRQASKREA